MKDYNIFLDKLKETGNLRSLPEVVHEGKWIWKEMQKMLNLSSNDYLGLASRKELREEFLREMQENDWLFSSSSSRLLTGNFKVYTELEECLFERFGREAALLFNSGYHANTGILPALADKQTLILADKLVHASIIDGLLLSGTPYQRYRHNDNEHLTRLLAKYTHEYEQIIIVTESIFSMDGDIADLRQLVSLKRQYPNVWLYVDEAHAIGVRGNTGLGIAEEQDCIGDIDLLVGTFGKALASMGAYLLCSRTIREYLINTMRPLIFSTALPPAQIAWTRYIFEKLPEFTEERQRLATTSRLLSDALKGKGGEISSSHIIPFIIGESEDCVETSLRLQRKGFYCLPVRPPTVPKGTARIRFSLTANVTESEIKELINSID
ncbi:8-amino-7-oxononanoate synthase [Parabacteroides sp. AF17-28]|uniref:8-amino-7-oxononanoate synthase n=1 Tax=Parabacteroides sp. AF17-28 TaxID=2292241 RepID=UPI000F00FB5B|nr:8-amino-7-oxononanoate synthase [Parabacteroides sp. AF17-28]RHR60477.1 8-amino-7-oxononanoate synthase [Parabacteroides sp. AF17-28]